MAAARRRYPTIPRNQPEDTISGMLHDMMQVTNELGALVSEMRQQPDNAWQADVGAIEEKSTALLMELKHARMLVNNMYH